MNFRFLFPFEKIPHDSKIIIYGAGEMGQAYLEQIRLTGYCEIVGIVDRNYDEYSKNGLKVHSPQEIVNLTYDYIVIAVSGKFALPEIYRVLGNVGVEGEKIIYIGSRVKEARITVSVDKSVQSNNDHIKVAFYLQCRIGSMIFLKRWIVELVKLLPDCEVDLYCVNLEDFARYLFSDMKNVKRVYNNLGYRYNTNKESYTFAARLSGGGWIDIDVFKPENIPHKAFIDKIQLLRETLSKVEYDTATTPRIVSFERSRFLGENAYTALGFGVFDLSDIRVNIPLTANGKKRYEELGLKRYITFNTGNGTSTASSIIAKSWPREYFCETIGLFRGKYPDIEIVQIGDKTSREIPFATHYVFGESFETVAYVLKNSIFHLDIEGGLTHIASQLGTKCAVLFGPTPKYYYGYKNNINISAGDCHECCGLYLDHNKCAAGYEKPKCMYAIKPDMVMAYIDDYMSSIL